MALLEEKRLAIIAAAKEEFIEHGFTGANMDRVCTSAEVSKRTLYRHFKSKDVLFESILGIIKSSINERQSYPFDRQISIYDQLVSITRNEVEILYHTYGIPFTRVIMFEFLRQPELAQQIIAKLYRSKALTVWFEQAQQSGAIKHINISLLSDTYSSIFNGLFLWPSVFNMQELPTETEIEQKVEHLVFVITSTCEAANTNPNLTYNE
ncbi:TetR/AcrR family transcriptional regulator [Vibrio alfacsensis]|uniref:TetR/AcrR family transcriptional regulator n=1 Tax=Vibrio alfacsensis TaxID=1074311 RepID=UPI001BF094B7|nr:TetR/AcrR family transcriptional regulator [Vibrio alfacsensis]WQE78563.1 TetR/AcrR family transcriptional regulator [Vibrio alfacsensis]BCN26411.1 TetR family transcriptional regulator [Vibrio alfacsensis]